MLPDVRIEPAAVCIPGGRAADRATMPGLVRLWLHNCRLRNELRHSKSYKLTCSSSEDTDQSVHPTSLISLGCLHWEALCPAKTPLRLCGNTCWYKSLQRPFKSCCVSDHLVRTKISSLKWNRWGYFVIIKGELLKITANFLNIRTPQKICCNQPKSAQKLNKMTSP